MSDDVKAMVNQWVFRQSLGPITPIAFLEGLKQLLKQWGKKGYEVLLRSSLEQCKMRNVKQHWVFCWKSHFVPRPSIKRVPSYSVVSTWFNMFQHVTPQFDMGSIAKGDYLWTFLDCSSVIGGMRTLETWSTLWRYTCLANMRQKSSAYKTIYIYVI